MKIADTSALYAVLDADDPHHATATQALSQGEPVLIPAEVWAETINLVQHRRSQDAAREAARALRELPHVEIQPTPDTPWDDIARRAAQIHDTVPNLSLIDATVVAWCHRKEATPFAFDDALLAACPPTPK